MSTTGYKIKVAVAVGIGLAVVGVASLLVSRQLPPPADCVKDARNPYRFRDWAHYVDGLEKRGAAACVVLISDSQAYAGEYPAHKGYPARLEVLLNERRTGGHERWEVLNLSMDGATPMEYMALASRLRDEAPLWLISVSGSADYRAENFEKGFAFCRSDLPHLLTEWPLARRMPLTFWRRHGRVEDTLTAWVAHRMPLLRFRDFLWSWLDTRFPGAQKAFYAPQTTYRFWELPGKALIAPVPSPMPEKGGEHLDLTYDERSTDMLRDFLAQLARIPAAHRLVVAAPLCTTAATKKDLAWVQAFRVDLARLAGESGLPCWDLTETLPPEDFITSSHFHNRNQIRMAELLADRIAVETGP